MSTGIKMEVTDYARLEKLAVEMPPPPVVVAVCGKNGSGKTTMLQAMAAAFAYRDRGYTVRRGQTDATIRVDLPDGKRIDMHLSEGGRASYRLDGKSTTASEVAELAPALSVSLEKWAGLTMREAVLECRRIVKDFDADALLVEQDKLDAYLEPSGEPGSLRHAKRVLDHAQRNLDMIPHVATIDTEPLPMPAAPEARRLSPAFDSDIESERKALGDAAGTYDAALERDGEERKVARLREAKAVELEAVEAEEKRLWRAYEDAVRRKTCLAGELSELPEVDVDATRALVLAAREKLETAKSRCQVAERRKADAQKIIEERNEEAHAEYSAAMQLTAAENAKRSAAKVQAQQREKALEEVVSAKREHQRIEREIEAARKAQSAILSAAKWPLPGMMIGGAGIIYNGIPLARASAGERLRIGVALSAAMAGDGEKIFTIENASLLDEDAWELVKGLAERHNATILAEIVGEDPAIDLPRIIIREGVSVPPEKE